MLRLEQTIRQNKRTTILAIAGAAAAVVVSLAAFGVLSVLDLSAVNSPFSVLYEEASKAFAALSESADSAIASVRNLLEQ